MTKKLCECGCGQPAPIATRTNHVFGHIKGEPCRFIRGHSTTGKKLRKRTEEEKNNIRFHKLGSKNPNWKGNNASKNSARGRAIRNYKLEPCEKCGNIVSERHHKDGNTYNNDTDNIMFLCRKCHMIEDGRMINFLEMSEKNRPKLFNKKVKLTEKDVIEIRWFRRFGLTLKDISTLYSISVFHVSKVTTRRIWKHIP